MGISINGPSGIDTASLIEQLVALEQEKVTKVQTKKSNYQVQIDAYSKLKSYLSDIAAKAMALNSLGSFDVYTSSSSDDSAVTIKGGVGSVEGSYDLTVFHLAKKEKMISRDGAVNSQSASLSSLGIHVGDISISGTSITISATDTVQDLRMKINNATDSEGNKLGVTASVLKMSDTNYRLVLSAKNTGGTGIEYKDLTGSVFQDLGIISTAAGEKGNAAQALTTQDNFKAAFDALAAGAAIQYSGVDHDGNEVTNTFIKTAAGTTIDEFLSQVKATYHGMVDAKVDGATGQLVVTDLISGSSQLGLDSLDAAGTAYATAMSQQGKEGLGVLSTGSDAYFNLDGLNMHNASNAPEGIITGATLQFHKASVTDVTSVSLERDIAGVQKKVQDLLDSYNALLKFAGDSTKVADPNNKDDKSGDLSGDMTVQSIVSQVRSELHTQFGLFGGTVTNLTMIGVKTDSKTGEMSIDKDMFTKAITTNYDEFTRLFVTTGVSDNKTIAYGRSTADTQSGKYTLRESDPDHVQIQIDGGAAWYTSDVRVGDVVTFSDGPAKGLSMTIPSGSLGGADTAYTYSKGLGDRLRYLADSFNAAGTGSIITHQDSLRNLMKSSDDRIDMLQRSVNAYHDRLVTQFAAMEQMLSSLKTQSANMLSALGQTSSS
jgi:flagellar hook-associated protein 2